MNQPITWLLAATAMLATVPQQAIANDLEANKALVRAFLKALEAGDMAAMVAIRGGGGPTHGPNGESRVSAAGSSLAERCPMCAALPDRKITIDGMVAEGDLVSVRSTWTGTYSGGYRGMEIATPKSVTVRYSNTYRIANGKIVENWASYDRLALAEQLGLALMPNLRQTQSAVAPAGIVGTWRLTAFEDTEDGKTVYRFGERPNGLFVYTADGHVIIHIANPANPNCLAPAKKYGPGKIDETPVPACTPAQMQAAMEGTVAYMGTYSVAMDKDDPGKGVVTHRVTADLSNGYIGTDQPRPFRIDGDRIEIGDGKTWRRVLERVHN